MASRKRSRAPVTGSSPGYVIVGRRSQRQARAAAALATAASNRRKPRP
jgi:hypothetical protein